MGSTLIGPACAVAIAVVAWRAGSLSASGAVAAVVVGSTAMLAGWPWGLFLVGWFAIATIASRVGRTAKQQRTGDVVAKGGTRDAVQVLANGGVYGAAALVAILHPDMAGVAAVGAAGALVAAGADTLATETGTLWRGQPFSLRTFTGVPTGTSGAVSVPGTAGLLLAAVGLALLATWVGLIASSAVPAVIMAGAAGAMADTLVGAWWQARRWCPVCARETEQVVHQCGTGTRHHAGLAWLTNDVVNALCTLVGAVLAIRLS